jgi:hypothetical protein
MEEVIGMRGLQRRLKAIGRTPDELLADWPMRTIRNAKVSHRPHKKTGLTERSIQPGRRGKDEATVQAGGASVFLEYGTRPHTIVPRRARMLAWAPDAANRRLSGAIRKGVASKDLIFARRVHHPGTKADPFLVPAGQDALEEFLGQDPVQRLWNKAD